LSFPALAAVLLLFGGCTVQRFQADTAAALEWLRLSHGSRIDATARWQLARGTRIQVVEVAPAPDPAWLAAAQAGVDRAYPGVGPAADAPFQLLVSWPRQDDVPAARQVSLWEVIDMDQYLPDFQSTLHLQVALVRRADGVLVEAAALRATPYWFAPESSAPQLVQTAFQDFAATFTTRY
jgi:hypothetical protein